MSVELAFLLAGSFVPSDQESARRAQQEQDRTIAENSAAPPRLVVKVLDNKATVAVVHLCRA